MSCMCEIHRSQDVVLCVPRAPQTFAESAKSYTKPWSVHATLKNREKKDQGSPVSVLNSGTL